jgi:50S ribosomal subunit-associated GTPase HflX
MAKIYEEILVIKVSKLVADKEASPKTIIGNDIVESIEEVVQQLVGDSVIVETEKAE